LKNKASYSGVEKQGFVLWSSALAGARYLQPEEKLLLPVKRNESEGTFRDNVITE
jgi:hypothetical protein